MEHYNVTLVSQRRSPQIAAARVHVDSDDCCIELSFDEYLLTGTGDDFFESFCKIREQLEAMELLPLCYAAHLHAFPSPMSRSMGGGLQLYLLTLGAPARLRDLIHMFEVDDKVIPSTVSDQQAFYDKWLASLISK